MSLKRFLLPGIIVLALLDFGTFAVVTAKYGGAVPSTPMFSAVPAHGPYLLDSHGRYTEVDRQTYTYLEWQSRSLFILWPLAGVYWWSSNRKRLRSKAL